MATRRLQLAFLALALAVPPMHGCAELGVGKRSDAVKAVALEDSSGFDASVLEGVDPSQAFELTLWARVRTDCASCHGAGQSPTFAVEDVAESRAAIEPYVDLDDPASSPILSRVQDGHCGSACSQGAADFQELIEAWAGVENGQ